MMSKLKFVIDKSIPFIKGVFEPYADILYIAGKDIASSDVKNADALIIRTRTKCNKELLEGSSVKIIATATIGTDHIDFDWCNENRIMVSNAAGCNAGGVVEYVFSALYGTAARKYINLNNFTIGIIGVGCVGRRIENMARYLGFNVLKNDPPREAVEGHFEFCNLDELLHQSDVVTLHVPLTENTEKLADAKFFSAMKKGAFFINTSRGEVVDEQALLKAIPKLGPVIIDTWNNEPDINRELLDKVDIATPHIAGYSYQGKQNGTAASVRAVARFFGIEDLYEFFPETDIPEHESVRLDLAGLNQGEIASIFQYNYPIFTDDFMFRLAPENFEKLRTEYNYRREIYIA